MDNHAVIIDAVAKLAAGVPAEVVERVADVLSALGDSYDLRTRVADAVPQSAHRDACRKFIDGWLSHPPVASAAELAMALRMAAHLVRVHNQAQTVELAWTGPHSQTIAHRRTEQAIIEVIDRAMKRLTIVSYAVYRIPNVGKAVVRAAQRNVKVTVIVETPDKMEGQNEYNTIRALGPEVASCSTLYYWPKDQRKPDTQGKTGILHVKCVVSDGQWLFLSSANLTEYAFSLNMELGVLITGGKQPLVVERQFQELIGDGVLQEVNPGD